MAAAFDELEQRPPRSRRWLYILLAMLVAFAAGAIAMGWALTHWDVAQRYIRPETPAPAAPAPARAPAAQAMVSAPALIAATTAVDERVATLEGRLDQIDARARQASGNAGRAEGLLVAFAARRALDRGVDLGYIEALLRDRFGGTQPQAVAMVIAAARRPVTLPQLRVGLEDAAPALAAGGTSISWWQGLRRELANLIVVRRPGTPPSDPEERIERARRLLEAGQVDGALAEIARLPGRAAATAWMAQAARYVKARVALDRIETAALLDPATSATAPAVPEADASARDAIVPGTPDGGDAAPETPIRP